MRLFRSLLACVAIASLAFGSIAPARATETILQLDLLVIKQPSWVRNRDSSPWPVREQEELASALDPTTLPPNSDMVWLPNAESGIGPEAEKLEAQGYETLYQASFRFPQQRLRNAPAFLLAQGDPIAIEAENPYAGEGALDAAWFDRETTLEPTVLAPINGWIRSWVDTYLFVEFDIARLLTDAPLRTQLESAPANDWGATNSFSSATSGFTPSQSRTLNTNNNLPISSSQQSWPSASSSNGAWSTVDVWPREAVQMHRIAQRKRVRLNEIHYFDHPQFAVLLRVTEPAFLNDAGTPE